MTVSSDREPGASGEIVEFGRPARHRWLGAVALVCLVVATITVILTRGSSHRPAPPSPVGITSVGHPILGIRAGWDLFGLDPGGLVRIEFARGTIVRTTIPPIEGDGIVSLVAARGEVLLRPLDDVPGYAVPDGKPARRLTGTLARGGTLLPGPSPAEEWLESGNIVLVGPGGKAERSHLPLVAQLWPPDQPPIADGRGGLVLPWSHGVYDVTPGALRLINALLLATGPSSWLGLSCANTTCHAVVISLATGLSRTLPGNSVSALSWQLSSLPGAGPWPWENLPGVVAPNGSAAAVVVPSDGAGRPSLELINLNSGGAVRIAVPMGSGSSSQSLAWSPDSRWLFAVTARGTLAAVDARTGHVQNLEIGVSGLSQIVVRPASS